MNTELGNTDTHMTLLRRALVADVGGAHTPAYIAPTITGETHLDWNAARHLLYFSLNGVDEAPTAWGHTFLLNAFLLAPVDGRDGTARRLQAALSLFSGPPYVTERRRWEEQRPTPPEKSRRLLALRRHVYRWIERDPDLLRRVARRCEVVLGTLLRPVPWSPERSQVDMRVVQSEYARSLGPMPVPSLTYLSWGDAAEFDALRAMGRHGAARPAYVHRGRRLLFVRLPTYVKNIWDLQERTPFIDYRNAAGTIPPDELTRGVAAAKAWLTDYARAAPEVAKEAVLMAMNLPPSETDLIVYAEPRGTPKGRPSAHAQLHRVNLPPALVGGFNLPESIRVSGRGKWVSIEDIGRTPAALSDHWAMRKTGRSPDDFIANHVTNVGGVPVVEVSVLPEAMRPDLAVQLVAALYPKQADAAPDPEVSRSKKLTARVSLGKRTRLKLGFTREEDDVIYASASAHLSNTTHAALCALMPHHAGYRVRYRYLMWGMLKRRNITPSDFTPSLEALDALVGTKEAHRVKLGL